MSPNTRSSVGKRSAVLAAVALACVLDAGIALAQDLRAPPLPPSVVGLAPNLTVRGGGEFTFFGFSVYDGWFWSTAREWPSNGPYALDLHYHRDLDGVKIAERSADEIARLGYGTAEERARWLREMARIFPNVRRGDRLTGVTTAPGAVRYYYNGTLVGEIYEPGFAQAFFGIWLDPRTSRDDFRQRLLGAR